MEAVAPKNESATTTKPVRKQWKIAIRIVSFVLIGLVLFFLVQELLRPRWNYPNFHENTSLSIKSYLNLEESSEQVIFIGTSHMLFGVTPMQLYEDTGIVSYNLATSAQSVEGTYYLLKEALKTQSPEVVVMDVSNLFFEEDTTRDIDVSMRYILDSLPLSTTKLEMAWTYANLADQYTSITDTNRFERFFSALFPIVQYHSRWAELQITDFRDYINASNYYTAGYYISTRVKNGSTSVDEMNTYAESQAERITGFGVIYEDGVRSDFDHIDPLYDPTIPDFAVSYLQKIQKLCADNGSELLLVKIPSVQSVTDYSSAWTEIKSQQIKELAAENGITYLDLLYDVDVGLDLSEDTSDGGKHMNIQGAEKVTEALGEYLTAHYDLSAQSNDLYDENLTIYQNVSDVIDLETETDFLSYLARLKEMKDQVIIAISVGDDAEDGLTSVQMNALNDLGLQMDFEADFYFRNSYLAIIDGGVTKYEATANRELEYHYENGIAIDIVSAGYNDGDESSILVDGVEYSRDKRGFNIVVCDKESGLVIDSVSFDVDSGKKCEGSRTVADMLDYWGAYEQFQIAKYK